jgi:O-antigen/teichoic acid export membrane protein
MLQGLSGPQSVGFFSAAALIAQVPIATLANCIGPYNYSLAVAALEFRTPQAVRAQLDRNFVFLLGLVLPGAAAIVALSENLAHVIVGAAYGDTVIQLAPWLAGTAALSSMRGFYVDTAFQLANKVSALTWINLITILVNVALDFWLIPLYGAQGAAISSFMAIVVSLIIASIWSRSVFRLSIPYMDAAKIIASTAFMFLALRVLNGAFGVPALAAQVVVGLAVYLAGMVAFNVLGIQYEMNKHLPRVRRLFVRAR